jgi:hypothetical protein
MFPLQNKIKFRFADYYCNELMKLNAIGYAMKNLAKTVQIRITLKLNGGL